MKRIRMTLLILLGASMTLASCSMHKVMMSERIDRNSIGSEEIAQDSTSAVAKPRMLIYDAELRMVVKNFDSANVTIASIAEHYGGYVQSLGSGRSVIRVKTEYLNAALTDMAGIGKINEKKVYGDDITDEYTDYSIRLENMTKARQRYLELLAKAENVQAALLVEKELERLNGEIDQMEGRMKNLSHRVAYSTITIIMQEKVKPGIIGYIGIGLYYGVKWLFVRN